MRICPNDSSHELQADNGQDWIEPQACIECSDDDGNGTVAIVLKPDSIIEDLITLVKKYATEACQCDIMYGYQCSIHNQVREDLKEVLDKYEYKLEVKV